MPLTSKTLTINFASILSANAISRIIAFVYFTLLARYLGAAGAGVYGYLLVFVQLGNIFADAGINRMLIRDVARKHELGQSYLDDILSLRLILSVAGCFFLFIGLRFWQNDPRVISLAPLALFSVLPYSLALTFDGLLKAWEKMRQSAVASISFEISRLLLLLAVIYGNWGLDGVFIMFVFSYLLYAIILTVFLRQNDISLHFTLKLEAWKRVLLLSAPFALLGILELIHGKLDLVLLKALLKDNTEVGYYFVAYRLMDVVLILPAALNITLLPRFSRHFVDNTSRIAQSYGRLLRLLFLCGIAVAGMTFFFSDFVIRLAFGSGYMPSAAILRILSVSMFFFFVHYANATFLAASNLQWKIFVFSVIQVIVNGIANMLLIPRYGTHGAAWANNLSIALGFVMFSILIRRHLRDFKDAPKTTEQNTTSLEYQR
jgi:PST family polysaccharide transporter